MTLPEWIKPAAAGAVAGAIVLAILGFNMAGWVTAGTAEQRASQQAERAVVAALVPICLEQAKIDPQHDDRLAQLKEASSWGRDDVVSEAGWATMPGAQEPARGVADACAKSLADAA